MNMEKLENYVVARLSEAEMVQLESAMRKARSRKVTENVEAIRADIRIATIADKTFREHLKRFSAMSEAEMVRTLRGIYSYNPFVDGELSASNRKLRTFLNRKLDTYEKRGSKSKLFARVELRTIRPAHEPSKVVDNWRVAHGRPSTYNGDRDLSTELDRCNRARRMAR